MNQRFRITAEDFRQFSVFLEQSCGILLAEHKQYLVQSRLGKIMKEQSCDSLSDLVDRLKRPGGNALKDAVIDAMTTNETLWFRDIHPYEILAKRLLPEYASERRGQKLRIWSSACSSGQEPYSISMVIDEFKRTTPGALSAGEEILATDISTTILQQAQKGEYEMLALGRGLSQDRLKKYFVASGDGSWQIRPEIKARVRFQNLNLLGQYASLGQFDIIFCRNVLIYFSSDVKIEILRKMRRQLKPGGYLLLGASESLSGLSDIYKMIHCRPGIIYQAI
ncbi:Chemotaxis protein methyltransferase CheR [Marinobacterium lacunae]|uniref:Chemotaxis protein methyltransferase n=1 Tax=Marinobacterium lacunae TaxID=1232683 RepID=A0A081G0M7_9GAMM|nr:protein-glutamate O-methyltransferase CheR [Marinobacterium lacunae]KEA64332.1 Chemotaxis protein methyltransferase CheR [Marinobacterium lacunae]